MSRPAALTPVELECIDALSVVANLFGQVVTKGEQRDHDLREVVDKIHQLQAMVLSQAACRAYPDKFRPLGSGWNDQ